MLDTITTSPPPKVAQPPSAGSFQFESALQSAFPAIDASQDALAHLADVPPASELLAVAPNPPRISLEELIREFANHPIVIIRNAGVPITALIAIGGALFLHFLLVGLFLLALYLGLHNTRPGHGDFTIAGEEGGAGDGFMIQGSAPPGESASPALTGNVEDLLAHAPASPPSLEFPKIPDSLTSTRLAAEQLAAASLEPDLIGTPTPSFSTPLKPRAIPTPAPMAALVVAPPAPTVPSKNNTNTFALAGRTGPTASSPNAGTGDGGDFEGPAIALLKPGKGGLGHGHGNKVGNGLDRGDSGADNLSPSVLDAPPVDLPNEIGLSPPDKPAIFEVTVLANGTAGTITLTHSCGNPEIDALCLATIRRYRFRAAYVAGKFVEKTMTITQDFGGGGEGTLH